MKYNLRSRLQRRRGLADPDPPSGRRPETAPAEHPAYDAMGPEWTQAGYLTVKRTLLLEAPPFPPVFPPASEILIPDLLRYAPGAAGPEDLLFFDLETTGLSSGAGVTPFLAAFGRLVPGGGAGSLNLEVTQYLLLDYPGEDDFLEAALGEFLPPVDSRREERAGKAPLTVTYNGKSFDAQVLKTRCLLKGKAPPLFFHADLLHPARRLWKRVLPSCSQGEIETAVLGLDRTGDTPGALAPDIWFAFLNTREPAALRGVCDHNVKDAAGLAGLFSALLRIAADPRGTHPVYRYDLEALALHWRKLRPGTPGLNRGVDEGETVKAGEALLALAAGQGRPLAALALARDLFRAGDAEAGRGRLQRVAEGEHSPSIRARACRSLAIDAERRLRDAPLALSYTEAALRLPALPSGIREDLTRRRDRLRKKRGGPLS